MNYNEISPYVRSFTTCMADGDSDSAQAEKYFLYDHMMIYIRKGMLTLLTDDCRHTCHTNDIILLQPGQTYAITNIAANTVYDMIRFDLKYDEYSERITESIDIFSKIKNHTSDIGEREYRTDWPIPLPVIRLEDTTETVKLFTDLYNLEKYRPDYYAFEMKILMLRLILLILKELGGGPSRQKESRKLSADPIFTVKEYLETHVYQVLTLEEISRKFNYNKYHLEKKFNKYFGMPISRYFNILRVEAAKEQIRNHVSVTQIAEMLSFHSIYSFSRFFKRHVGVSPANFLEYEKNNYHIPRKKYILEENQKYIPFASDADFVETVFYTNFADTDDPCEGKAQYSTFFGTDVDVVENQLILNYDSHKHRYVKNGMNTFVPNARVSPEDYSQVQLSFALQNFILDGLGGGCPWCSAMWGCYVTDPINYLPDSPGDGIWFSFSSEDYIAVYGGSIGGWGEGFAKIPIPVNFSIMREAAIVCTDDYQIHIYITIGDEGEKKTVLAARIVFTEEKVFIYDASGELLFQEENDFQTICNGDHFVLFTHCSVTILDYVKILGS